MSMKRMISLLITMTMLMGMASVAFAQPEPLRVLSGNDGSAAAYQEAYPERAIRIIPVDYQLDDRGNLAELIQEGDWDVAIIGTQEFALAQLVDAGAAMDISTYPELTKLADNLYPSIRDAVTVRGKLAAFPVYGASSLVMGFEMMGASTSFSGTYQQHAAAHLQALGMTAKDQPGTFAELCALGERYMRQTKEARKGTTFITLEGNTTQFVLNLLMDLYTTQYLATGQCENFDTEVFRTALSQLDDLSAALATDPKNTFDTDGICYPLLLDSSQTLVNEVTFLQLGDHQTIPSWMDMIIINPKSPRIQEAVDYILLTNDQYECHTAPTFYQTIDVKALAWQSYDQDIAAQIEEQEDQSVIDRLIALRDAGDTGRYLDQAEIAYYRKEIAPRLVFPQTTYLDTQNAVTQYLLGKLDTEGFIAALNKAMEE